MTDRYDSRNLRTAWSQDNINNGSRWVEPSRSKPTMLLSEIRDRNLATTHRQDPSAQLLNEVRVQRRRQHSGVQSAGNEVLAFKTDRNQHHRNESVGGNEIESWIEHVLIYGNTFDHVITQMKTYSSVLRKIKLAYEAYIDYLVRTDGSVPRTISAPELYHRLRKTDGPGSMTSRSVVTGSQQRINQPKTAKDTVPIAANGMAKPSQRQNAGRHVAHQVAQLQAKILQRQGDIEVLKSGTGGAASHDGAADLRNWIADADKKIDAERMQEMSAMKRIRELEMGLHELLIRGRAPERVIRDVWTRLDTSAKFTVM